MGKEEKIIPTGNPPIVVDIADEMRTSFLEYAMSVIVSRALPDVKDGLKPVHRRIIYAMNDLNMTAGSAYKKSARIVGEVIGKYHPHGDTSVYEAMVRMAQDFSYRYPLIDGHGNFGSMDGDAPAAMRYTEARMSKISGELIRDIDKATVPFGDNYDGSEKEPLYLTGYFPNLLVNGANGIAVGMATNIPPHNLKEVIAGTLALIDNPDLTIEDLMQHIKGPDFPTGALITAGDSLHQAYTTGNGSVTIRSKLRIEDNTHNGRHIVIDEIPYQVNKAKLLEKIAELVKDKILVGVSDLRDESNREGVRVIIELNRNAQERVLINKLYKLTPLQVNFSINLLALHHNQPKVMNLKQILQYFIDHQIDVIIKRSKFDLAKAEARLTILQGLKIALDNIDRVIEIIRNSQTTSIASNSLMEEFKLLEVQVKAILEMKLQRLTGLEKNKINEEIKELNELVSELNEIIATPERQRQLVKTELSQLSDRYGDNRRSTIIQEELTNIDPESLIRQEDVLIVLTKEGYIKRTTQDSFRLQKRGGKGVTGINSDSDFIHKVISASTLDDLLIFSNLGKVYRLKVYEIDSYSRTAHGIPIVNLINIEKSEKIITILPLSKTDWDLYQNLIFVTRNGLIKKTLLKEYELIRQSGKNAITLRDEDELIDVVASIGDQEIVIANSVGKIVRFNEKLIKPLGRIASGVIGINNDEGAITVGVCVGYDSTSLLSVSELGSGKKTLISEYRLTARGAKGVKSMNLTDKTGVLATIKLIKPNQDIVIATKAGYMIRFSEADVPQLGRTTSGVRLIRVHDDQINEVAIINHSNQEEGAHDQNDKS